MAEKIDYEKIALDFAHSVNKELGTSFDKVRYAGEQNGYKYYQFYDSSLLGKKFYGFMYCYVKIDKQGNLTHISDFYETAWAREQNIKLNHLGDRSKDSLI